MSKFLTLVENYNPENSTFISNVHDLKMLLKSHGVKFGVTGDGVFYIDDAANDKTYVVEIKGIETSNNAEEDVESIDAGTGTYEIDKEVQNLANTASSGIKGFGAKLFGTSAQQAKGAVAERQKLAKDAVAAYKKGSERIRNGLKAVNNTATNVRY
jgi:hypothetical protein